MQITAANTAYITKNTFIDLKQEGFSFIRIDEAQEAVIDGAYFTNVTGSATNSRYTCISAFMKPGAKMSINDL